MSIIGEFRTFFWKRGYGWNWEHSLPNFSHLIFFLHFLEEGTKSKVPNMFLWTQKRYHQGTYSYHYFPFTCFYLFEIWLFLKMCAKLGTVPLMWVSVRCELLFHNSKQCISKLYSLLFWLNNSRQNTGPVHKRFHRKPFWSSDINRSEYILFQLTNLKKHFN
jgi:hypothetical protein